MPPLSSSQFTEAMVYDQVEPWGEERGDLRMAINTSWVANLWRNPNRKPFKPQDFMPRFVERERPSASTLWTRLTGVLDRMTRKKDAGTSG